MKEEKKMIQDRHQGAIAETEAKLNNFWEN